MKEFVKNIGAVIIVCAMIIAGVLYLGELFSPFYTTETNDTIDAFHDLEENTVEVIVYGSSHAWKGFDVMAMYEEYGIGGYNYGCNWQHINTTRLFVEDSFRTQKPKVILIETYLIGEMLMDIDMNGEVFYTREISHFDGKQRYLKQVFGDKKNRYISYYVPFVAFHSNWNNLTRQNFDKDMCKIDFKKTMGYYSSSSTMKVEMPDYTKNYQGELWQKVVDEMDAIVKLCKENDVEIIFYTAPHAYEYRFYNAMKEYAEKTGTKYINLLEYMDEMGFDPNTDFWDKGHLNSSGSKKVALFLGKYMTDNYELTDMRNIDGNQWQENLGD